MLDNTVIVYLSDGAEHHSRLMGMAVHHDW